MSKLFEQNLSVVLDVSPWVPLTQLVILDFRELLHSIVMKVVSCYITLESYITSFGWK